MKAKLVWPPDDGDVLLALAGAKLTVRNSMSGKTEEIKLPQLWIDGEGDARTVHFVSRGADGGHRAIRLSAIEKVTQ